MTITEVDEREIRALYWDHVFLTKAPTFTYSVAEIAKAYGFANGKELRRDVDLSSDQGINCPDCNRILSVRSRHEYREAMEHPRRCKSCEAKARQRLIAAHIARPVRAAPISSAPVAPPTPQPQKAMVMPNVSTVMSGEAAVHTIQNGTEIELRLPTLSAGQDYPPMMKLLAAIVHRADEDLGWWEDQVRWYDAYMREKRFAKTRLKLRLVGDDE